MLKILNKSQIAHLENEVKISRHLTESQLVSQAGKAFYHEFTKIIKDIDLTILILCGNGNNGADGLEIANLLSSAGYNVEVGVILIAKKSSDTFRHKLENLFSSIPTIELDVQDLHDFTLPFYDVLIDGILGSGINRELPTELQSLITRINQNKQPVFSIDIASGLSCEGTLPKVAIRPHYTIAMGTIKPAYFLAEGVDHVGILIFARIQSFEECLSQIKSHEFWINPSSAKKILKPYNRLDHKYIHGIASIIGGSYGMSGCIKLSGEAALRSGCGVVYLHVPYNSVDFLQSSLPEAIIHPDDFKYHIGSFENNMRFTAIGIGPGMGYKIKQSEMFGGLLDDNKTIPMVIDADALTILSGWDDWPRRINCPVILTPHKGEFERLFGKFETQQQRVDAMRNHSTKYGHVILLKGADTVISGPDGSVYFSNTGNSGMATAGSGDVLTGILTGLLAQGYSPIDTAILGSQIHGLSGNIAEANWGKRSIIAGDLVKNIGLAIQSIENQ
ncbi:MAG TPA: NAD(P)H-hydrate dehydratase [Saprospiraceae bacterium]|nr:NAD(P)H-hydrate dehydratase [Saprospiraceae bacterium]